MVTPQDYAPLGVPGLIGATSQDLDPAANLTKGRLSGTEQLYPSAVPGPESILSPLPIDRAVKADAWDAFHATSTPEEFQNALDPIPIPLHAKASLWDMKFAPVVPAPKAATAKPAQAKIHVKAPAIAPPLPAPPVIPGPAAQYGLPAGLAAPKPLPTPTPGKEIAPDTYQIEAPAPPKKGPLVMSTKRTPITPDYTTEPTFQQARSMAAQKVSDAVDKNLPFLVGPFGIEKGFLKTVAQTVTDPVTGAIIVGTSGLGAVPGAAARVLQTGLSAYFATQAGKAFLQQAPQVAHRVAAGDWQGAAEEGGSALADAVMAVGAGAHALSGVVGGVRAGMDAAADFLDRFDRETANDPVAQKIAKLTYVAGRPESPVESEAARGRLKWKYGVDLGGRETGAGFSMPGDSDTGVVNQYPEAPGQAASAPPPAPQPVRTVRPPADITTGSTFSMPGDSDTGITYPSDQTAPPEPAPATAGQISAPETPQAKPPKPQSPFNVAAFTKSHDVWHKNVLNALAQVMKDHPGMPYDQAVQAASGSAGVEPQIGDYKALPAPPEPPQPLPAPPEPPKPDKVAKVGPGTENPPTAALPTEPESPETIALQMQQLAEGTRKVVMFPRGIGQPTVYPPGVDIRITNDGMGNTYAYRGDMTHSSAIHRAAHDNTLPELLGHSEMGMGTGDKAALDAAGKPQVAVVGHAPDGTEAHAALANEDTLPTAVAAAHAVTPEGGTVSVVTPEDALAERQGGPQAAEVDPSTAWVGDAMNLDRVSVAQNADGTVTLEVSPLSAAHRATSIATMEPDDAAAYNAADQLPNRERYQKQRALLGKLLETHDLNTREKLKTLRDSIHARERAEQAAGAESVQHGHAQIVRGTATFLEDLQQDLRTAMANTPHNAGVMADELEKSLVYAREHAEKLVAAPEEDRVHLQKTIADSEDLIGAVRSAAEQPQGNPESSFSVAGSSETGLGVPAPIGAHEIGPHGPIFSEFSGRPAEAIAKLQKEQTGEVPHVWHHPELGWIDLIWGNKQGGLDHIISKHVEGQRDLDLADLIEMIPTMRVADNNGRSATLESASHKAGIRLDYDGKTKTWLVTAYEKPPAGGYSVVSGSPQSAPQGGGHPPPDGSDFSLPTEWQPSTGPEVPPATSRPVNPLNYAQATNAAKKLGIDTSQFDRTTIEGRQQLAAAIRAARARPKPSGWRDAPWGSSGPFEADAWRTPRIDNSHDDEAGAFFAEDQSEASRYHRQSGINASYQERVKLKNAYFAFDKADALKEFGLDDVLAQYQNGELDLPDQDNDWLIDRAIAAAAKADGKDGIVYSNDSDGFRSVQVLDPPAAPYIPGFSSVPVPEQSPEAQETGVVSNREPAAEIAAGEPAAYSGTDGTERHGPENPGSLAEVQAEDGRSPSLVAESEPDGGGGGGSARPDLQPDPESGVRPGPGGRSGAGTVDQPGASGGGRSTGDLTRQTEGGDFRIAPSDHIGEGTPRQKVAANLEAIRVVKTLEKEGRPATPEEQEKLARYVGWGGLWQIFDYAKREFSGAREELRDLLTPEEFTAAEKSIKNAHYTSPEVIISMWNAMERFGVTPGFSVLEPSMGVGSFFGLQPDSLMPARRTGVELDRITGAIAKALYPDSNVQITGFEKMSLPNDFFDVSIGNVPFGNYPVYDPQYRRNRTAVRSIHNYFFVKSLDLTRPGGIVAFVTSRYTMDAQDSALRQLLASKADLLGMMRLPNTAFKGNAGTEVVTDVVFLRKRAEGQPASGPSFVDVREVPVGGGKTTVVNEYYAEHPEMMLGELSTEGSQYGPEEQTLDGNLTPELLQSAVDRLPQDVYSEWKADSPAATQGSDYVQLGDEVKDGGYAVKDGVIVQREGNIYRPAVVNKTQALRIRAMIPVKTALRQVFATQLSDAPEPEIVAARRELNKTYDAFVRVHGPLGSTANARALGDDPDYAPLAGALENYEKQSDSASKTDIFSKRTIEKPHLPDKADTAAEAMAMVLNERGRLDWNRMQELTGKTPDELRTELAGQVYQNPDGRKWETQDEYLSGNVRQKLDIAEKAAAIDPSYRRNVEALKEVQPRDLTPDDIKITPGAPWIPPDVVAQFLRQVLSLDSARVHYAPAVAAWSIEVPEYQTQRVANAKTFGTDDFEAHKLFDMALNGKSPRVYQDGPNHTRVFDAGATAVAQAAQDVLKDKFREWIWEDADRSQMLAAKYNREVNNLRLVDHDGAHLTLPGSNPAVSLRPHQKNVIWRALKTGNTLLAHEVGAGKTWELVGIAMESRRLGLAKKPMIAVPNHMAEQFTSDFLQIYPAARVLTIGREDFAAGKRKRAVSRIAGGNWDAVIIRHSSFEKIPVSDATYKSFIDQQIEELKAALDEQSKEVGKEAKKDKTVKEIQKAIARLEVKLENRLKREKKDDAVTFEQLGVDLLLVDEAHAFKALPIITRRTRVAGIPTRESDRATDMYMKTQYISALNGGRRGVVFATGTPVTNTMAELYNMQRYLQPKAMKDAGVEHFDAWANMFGDVRRGVELDVSGKGFRENTRFAKFINIPELMTMYRLMADVKTAEMMKLPRPDLEGGGPVAITAPESPELTAYVDHLIDRSEQVRGGNVDKRADNMLKIVSEGKKAALDMRLVDPDAEDRPTSKVNKAVDNIYRIWKKTEDQRSTQAVFCDLSTPKSAKTKTPTPVSAESDENDGTAAPEAAGERSGFSVYNDMRDKLVRAGVPSNEIAFIHDYAGDEQKQDLFDAVNAGKVRILFGSTEKMGVGTNVQKRMIALHHMDAPWRPADIKQRDGRIQRQGNMHPKVQIYQYITEGSFDAYSWQLLENKAAFIGPILSGDSTVREMEDVGMILPSAAEFKAMASGNPLIKEKIGTDAELGRLDAQRNGFRRQQSGIRQELASLPGRIVNLREGIEKSEADQRTVESHKDEGYVIGSQAFSGEDARKRAAEAMHAALQSWRGPGDPQLIGSYKGLRLWTRPGYIPNSYPDVTIRGQLSYYASGNPENPAGTLASIEATVRYEVRTALWRTNDLAESLAKQAQLEDLAGKQWPQEKRYQDLVKRKAELDAALDESEAEKAAASEDDEDESNKPIPKGTSYGERKRILLARARGEEVEYEAPQQATGTASGPKPGETKPAYGKDAGAIATYRKGPGAVAAPDGGWLTQTFDGKEFYSNGHFILQGDAPGKTNTRRVDMSRFLKMPDSATEIAPLAYSKDKALGRLVWFSSETSLDARYYDYAMKAFPDAKFFIGSDKTKLTVESGGDVVGTIMGIRADVPEGIKPLLAGPAGRAPSGNSEAGSATAGHMVGIAAASVAVAALIAAFRKKDVSAAVESYATLPPAQQKQVYRVVRDKAFSVRLKPDAWTPQARQIAKEIFKIKFYTPRYLPTDFAMPMPIQ